MESSSLTSIIGAAGTFVTSLMGNLFGRSNQKLVLRNEEQKKNMEMADEAKRKEISGLERRKNDLLVELSSHKQAMDAIYTYEDRFEKLVNTTDRLKISSRINTFPKGSEDRLSYATGTSEDIYQFTRECSRLFTDIASLLPKGDPYMEDRLKNLNEAGQEMASVGWQLEFAILSCDKGIDVIGHKMMGVEKRHNTVFDEFNKSCSKFRRAFQRIRDYHIDYNREIKDRIKEVDIELSFS